MSTPTFPPVPAMHPDTVVAPCGWEALPDADDFYPDDLPADWRLTYFANTLPAVLLPWSAWQAQPPAILQGWRDDVHGSFRFFLEVPRLPVTDAARMAVAARAAAALGPALGGWVASTLAVAPGSPVGCSAPAAAGMPPAAYAVVVPSELQGDLRAATAWLRALAAAEGGPPRLLLLPAAATATLTAWQHLLALLGWTPGAGAAAGGAG